MEHTWTILCEKAIIDKETNGTSLIQVIDQIKFYILGDVEGKIYIPLSLHVVTLWSRSDLDAPEQSRVHVELLSPEKEILLTYEYDVDLSQHPRSRRNQKFNGFPFTGSGLYWFVSSKLDNTTQEWVEVSSTPLQVIRDFSPDKLEEIKGMEMNQE